MRKLIILFVLVVVVAAGVYFGAGRMAGPTIEIVRPTRFVGVSTPLEIVVNVPPASLSALHVVFEQNGKQIDVTSTGATPGAGSVADENGRVRITQDIGRSNLPGITSGPARIVVTAARPVVFGLRHVETQVVRDVHVRLEPPRLSVVSTHHYLNLGGSEAIVYRVTPEDVQSGVTVGNIEYPGYPASGVDVPGVTLADPSLRVAFFALRYDQPPDTPMRLFARDEAGNAARADFDHRTFPKPFKKSRIEITDAFLARVVPAILAGTTEVTPGGAPIDQFIVLNGDLRRRNAEKIASFATETSSTMFWGGTVFHPFTNSSAESAFADQRTYLYQGKEVDHQVHLGFDLASYAGTSVVAANRGKVLFAQELGIYGNCVIIDHGMGVQSLYAHLSAIEVSAGATVEKGQSIGKSGMTGMAGGDHLHFTMLVGGQMVNPVEWWDAHWIEDRVLRKLRDAR